MMLQSLHIDRPYAQPRSPIEVDGERYELPSDFVAGLDFLRPFVKRKGKPVEWFVHVTDGRPCVLTNSVTIDFEIGSNSLPDIKLQPRAIRILAAFEQPPSHLVVGGSEFLFLWQDGQQCLFAGQKPFSEVWWGDHGPVQKLALIDRFWAFDNASAVDDETRSQLLKSHTGPAKDIYINGDAAISRISSDGKSWTSETLSKLPMDVQRPMRFDITAFRSVIRVADEIDFSTSPVSFRHANGRGLLIERTLGSDVPDGECSDE